MEPMTLLSRYTIKLFIKIYLISLISLFCMYFIIDMVSHLDRLSKATPESASLLDTLFQYYGVRCFTLFNTINATVVLFSAAATIATMQSKNELIALHSMGASPNQIAKPIIVVAIIMASLAATNRELIIPRFQQDLTRTAQNWTGNEKIPIQAKFDHRTDILFGGRHAIKSDSTILLPRLHLHRPLGRFPRIIEAQSAIYTSATKTQPAGYKLKNVTVPASLDSYSTAVFEGEPVIVTATDHPDLKDNELFVVSQLPFDLLVAQNNHYKFNSTKSLIGLLQNQSLDYGAHLRVQLHARFVQPVLDLTLLLLGLPFVLSGRNQSLLFSICGGVGTIVVFFGVVFTSHAVGASGYAISPSLAAWLPLFVLIPTTYFITKHIRR
tara:strand:- start:1010 stop:2155 length:1146 start_codon:yes stop_codon:yes gene_type:complete